MLKHYLKLILRSFLKSRIYTLINITGLTVGMVVFILIMLYVNFEFSVDQYHENKDRIYRVAKQDRGNLYLGDDRYALTMAPLSPTLMEEFPEVESATRIVLNREVLIRNGEETIFEPIIHGVDPETFKIFTFEYKYGNPDVFLRDKYSAVISESLAAKYYEDDNPIGKTFSIKEENEYEFRIVGVIKDMPDNSHFRMKIMVPFKTLVEINGSKDDLQNWGNSNYYTYFLLNKDSDPDDLEAKFTTMLDRHTSYHDSKGDPLIILFLQEFTRIHLYSDIHFDIGIPGNPKRLYILSTIAILILLIACINYMNLSTARATTRAKEVGIRKIAGAYRHNLILQFLGESLLLVFLSLPISLLIIALSLPQFNQFFDLYLSFNLLKSPEYITILIVTCGFVGIVSGSYPALVLSDFKPISVLKGNFSRSAKGLKLRNLLVVIQFVISGVLIICTLIITQQLNYIQKKDLGYDREHIINLNVFDEDILNKIPVLKEELKKVDGVLNVTSSSILPNGSLGSNNIRWPGKDDAINWQICTGRVDFNFIDLYEIEIIEGRNFSREAGDENGAILINESAASLLDWEDPIGRKLSDWRDTCTIVGIMKDFHLHPLHKEIMPLQLFFHDSDKKISIKITSHNIEKTLAGIKKIKDSFSEKYPFTYTFFDDEFRKTYVAEQKTGKLVNWITIITIIIACLGLYGLAAFTAEQRIKEVGIRKILGAPAFHLMYLLSKDFTFLVIISFLISAPIAYFSMQKWLSSFAYHIDVSIFFFIITLIAMLIIAWLTVGYNTFKIVNANPVDSLKVD